MNDQVAPIPIPLPTELPELPNLASLPSHIVHSGTVETLIGMNEDLVARLKVNIRRNAILEQKVFELEESLVGLTRLNDSLETQMMVLKEKDGVWKEKSQTVEARFVELQSEIQLWEVRYAELYGTLTDKQNEWKSERRDLELRLRALEGFKRRTSKWVRAYITRLRAQARDGLAHAEILDRHILERNEKILEMKEQIAALIREIHTRKESSEQDQAKLVEGYEARLSELEEQKTAAENELELHRERGQKLEQVLHQEAETANRNIFLERKCGEIEARAKAELEEMRKQLALYRNDAKTTHVELSGTKEMLARSEAEADELRKENHRLSDQLESLQILWTNAAKKLDESQLRIDSLTRLNQEISRKLKEFRSHPEIQLHTNLDAENEKIERIDSMLAELQSGFRRPAGHA